MTPRIRYQDIPASPPRYAPIRRTVMALGTAIGVAGAVLLLAGLFLFVLFDLQYRQNLGTKDELLHRNDQGVILTDRHGQPFFRFYDASYRKIVPLDAVSPHVANALVAAEDERFYRHTGFSIEAIARAAIDNAQAGGVVSGGSTITQQLAKNLFLSPEKSYWRKVQEVMLARQLERQLSKEEILEVYMNTAYFGAGAYGIETASQSYFNTPANELTLGQASMLVATLPAPSVLSPITGDLERAKEAQKHVLARMEERRYITAEERVAAENEELTFPSLEQAPLYESKAHHYAFLVLEELKKQFDEEILLGSGYQVTTTIDLGWQERAESVLSEQVDALKSQGVSNGGAVVIDPATGEVKAMVGSANWGNSDFGKYNVATALRQPGSSFKPIVFATAIDENLLTAATPLNDRPTRYPAPPGGEPYQPKNYDGRYRGTVLARRALANSLNVPAVQVMHTVGLERVLDRAERFGYTSLGDRSRFGLSLVLGTGEVTLLEHTGAYAALANRGERVAPTAILEVRDRNGEVVYRHEPKPERVVSAEAAYVISSILGDQDARREVFGRSLDLPDGRIAAVKTGTTQDYHDAWTLGYTPELAVGVWIGNNANTPMKEVAGALGPAPIWRALMAEFSGSEKRWYDPPANLEQLRVCRTNGLRTSSQGGSTYEEYFLPGTAPSGQCRFTAPSPEPEVESETEPAENKDATERQDRKDDREPPGRTRQEGGEG